MEDVAHVNQRCIGCGLCVTTCPTEAIALFRRGDDEIADVPKNEKEWFARREEARNGSQEYKKLFKKKE